MNLSEKEQVNGNTVNVLSLFGNSAPEIVIEDPMETLLEEAGTDTLKRQEVVARKVVDENQFPDQSMYILEDQLKSLRTSLSRIKFYLGELDDILPG